MESIFQSVNFHGAREECWIKLVQVVYQKLDSQHSDESI